MPTLALRISSARALASMRLFGVAALLVTAFVTNVQTQSVYTTLGVSTSQALSASNTYTPTNVWTAHPTCTSGSNAVAPQGGYGGGVYMDGYGTYWQVVCGFYWNGNTYYENPSGIEANQP